MALSEAEELELLELEEQEAAQSSSGGGSQWDVAKFAASQVSQMAPWNKANDLYKQGVGRVAEFAGSQGANPYMTAAALTPVAMAPEILGAATSFGGIKNSTNPTMKGLMNTPQELGPQYAAQNKAIGVTRRVVPEGGQLPKFAPPELQGLATRPPRPLVPAQPLPGEVPIRLPSKPGDFMSYANQKLGQFGDRINPQELMDWDVKLQTDMSNPNVIPRFDPKTGKTTTLYQQATDLSSRAGKVFNQVAEARLKASQLPEGVTPTRAALDQAYAISSKVQNATRTGLKSAWTVGKYGAGLYLAGTAIGEYVRRIIPNGR